MNNNQTEKKVATKSSLLTKLIFIALLSLVIITVISKNQSSTSLQEAASKNTFIEFPDRKPLPQVTLDQAGTNGFPTSNIKGKWNILYFGYTFCPDICPVELSALHQMMEVLRKDNIPESQLPQVIFISIDPARDTPEQVKTYVATFDKSFIGLSGKQDVLETLASPFGIAWSKDAVAKGNNEDFYTMSHSTTLLLVNPDSKVAGVFPAPHLAKDMVQVYKTIIKQ